MKFDNCPSCAVSLIGDPIPAEFRTHRPDCADVKARMGRCFCLPWGDITHFRREIGHEIPGVYDGVLYFACPDCGHAWQRWTKPDNLYYRAEPYIARHNRRAA